MEKDTFDIEFELPEIPNNAPVKPRIHKVEESVCISCEG